MPYSIFGSLDEVERAASGWKADVIWCGAAAGTRQQLRGDKQ
jgi:hypothetical protein